MQVMPVDLVALVASFMGILVVLIPVAGLTARFAIKPIAESLAKARASSTDSETITLLERRISLLESEVHGLGGMREDVSRMLEEIEFQRQLQAPKT